MSSSLDRSNEVYPITPSKDESALGIGVGKEFHPVTGVTKENSYWKYHETVEKFVGAHHPWNKEVLLSVLDPKVVAEFYGAPEPIRGADAFVNCWDGSLAAFPDWKPIPYWNTYTENGNFIQIYGASEGTHTGKPYTIPNSGLPAIPTTGKYVHEPVTTIQLVMNGQGKIAQMFLGKPFMGQVCGPAFFYQAIGGRLPDPVPTKKNLEVIRSWSQQTTQAYKGKEERFNVFANEAFTGTFEGAPQMPPMNARGMYSMVDGILASFPDFQVKIFEDTYKEIGGTATVEVQAGGTFNGAPYSFPPAMCLEPVKPTGQKVLNSVEVMTFVFTPSGKIASLSVAPTKDGTPGGPPGMYIRAGGKPSMPPSFMTDMRNIQVVQQCYQAFARGDIPYICSQTHPHVDWCWGEDSGVRLLPWYGRWVGHAGITKAFVEFGKVTEVLKFTPVSYNILPMNRIMCEVDIAARVKYTGKEAHFRIVHFFTFDDHGKMIKYTERSDTATMRELYVPNARY